MNQRFYSDSHCLSNHLLHEDLMRVDVHQKKSINDCSRVVRQYFCDDKIFIRPVLSCTSANTLAAISALKPGDLMLSSEIAHLLHYENDAIKRLGAIKIEPLRVTDGKISVQDLKDTLSASDRRCSLLSITQPTECGTVYTIKELKQIYSIASKKNVLVHIDGARFFYAVNYLKCSPKQMLDNCDFLTLGLTKFGNASGELLIFKNFSFMDRLTRLQELFSQVILGEKFVHAQIWDFFKQKLYIPSAKNSHELAVYICDSLKKLKVNLLYSVHANILYIQLEECMVPKISRFYKLSISSRHKNTVRLVTSYATTRADADEFIDKMRAIKLTSHF